jgi:tRNA (guanine-N7-)-methyltransferase
MYNERSVGPKDLHCPFRWEKREPCLDAGVFYVPTYYSDHSKEAFPGFLKLFGNDGSVKMEYCSGNGDWIVRRARDCPSYNWVAVEKRFDRVRKIWSKMRNLQLANLLIVSGDAMTFSREYLSEECVEEIFVNFPDPWPKRPHAKHRLVKAGFNIECCRILRQGGRITLVTDDPLYSSQIISVMHDGQMMESFFPFPYFITDWPDYGDSYFDTLWRTQGGSIRYHSFMKKVSV